MNLRFMASALSGSASSASAVALLPSSVVESIVLTCITAINLGESESGVQLSSELFFRVELS